MNWKSLLLAGAITMPPAFGSDLGLPPLPIPEDNPQTAE
jgi:hypothetical protein